MGPCLLVPCQGLVGKTCVGTFCCNQGLGVQCLWFRVLGLGLRSSSHEIFSSHEGFHTGASSLLTAVSLAVLPLRLETGVLLKSTCVTHEYSLWRVQGAGSQHMTGEGLQCLASSKLRKSLRVSGWPSFQECKEPRMPQNMRPYLSAALLNFAGTKQTPSFSLFHRSL